jgi:L-threonylcarbamoyladenylate synthase
VIDGGLTGVGLESTVLDCSTLCDDGEGNIPGGWPVLTILRPGGVTLEQLAAVCGEAAEVVGTSGSGLKAQGEDPEFRPRAPGMKYTHYAPKAPVRLVEGSDDFLRTVLARATQEEGLRVGVLTVEEKVGLFPGAAVVVSCGRGDDLASVGRGLYDALRQFDSTDVELVLAQTYSTEGFGQAVMNRLSKAAGHRVVREGDPVAPKS